MLRIFMGKLGWIVSTNVMEGAGGSR